MHRYFMVHKPYYMLSQFIGGHPGHRMLGDLDYAFPEGIHCVGRLDYTSEGLLLLTTNKAVTRLLFQSEEKHKRTYLVQAYKQVSPETLQLLRNGIVITVEEGANYRTTACKVEIVDRPADLPYTSYELRADIAQTWMTLTLTEGKYRQIRKMLENARHPCRRLIRLSIEDIELGDLQPGEVKELDEATFFQLLKIKQPGTTPETIIPG